MSNTFNFANWVAMKGLRRLTNKLQCAQFGNTTYGKDYKKDFAVGDTVRVPLPQKYTIRTGLTYTPQALGRPVTTIALQEPFGIDFDWDDFEAAVFMERQDAQIEEAYINPAMDQIAQTFDSRFATYAAQNCPNIVGVLGTDPTSFQTMNTAREILVQLAGWNGAGKRGMLIAPQVNTSLVNAAITYFHPMDNDDQWKDGAIGGAMGFKWYESMSLYSHTAGTYASAGALTVNGGSQQGSTISVNCTSGDIFNQGDVVAFGTVGGAGSYAVNPTTRTRTTSARLRPFVITQTVTASAATQTLNIYPAIFGPGSQFQNVDALPPASAVVTVFPGTSSPSTKAGINGLAITTDAFALVGVNLDEPKNQQISKTMRDPDTGIAVRFVRAWDPVQSKMINRWDACMGLGTLYGDCCAVRVLGA